MQVYGVVSDASFVIPKGGGLKAPDSRHFHCHSSLSHSNSFFSSAFFRSCPSFYLPKLRNGLYKYRARDVTMRASESSSGDLEPFAPLQFESPVGQLLAQILQTHPHLLPAAIDQQLESLGTDSDDTQKKDLSSYPQDLLYKVRSEFNPSTAIAFSSTTTYRTSVTSIPTLPSSFSTTTATISSSFA
uniref:Uncharacterized protein n=1 Tax=Cannabis sativa TaxID=3483 RepID=A0A803PS75_CANSA